MATEQDKFKNKSNAEGTWVRVPTFFHDKISNEPRVQYKAEQGRYRLYISYACPWAHRTLIVRTLKGLEDCINLTVTNYTVPFFSQDEDTKNYVGWEFVTKDGMNQKNDPSNPFYEPHGFTSMSQLYELARPGYREEYMKRDKRPLYSVPVLFDEKTQTIVTNESSEIIEMLNSEFNEWAKNPDLNLSPKDLQEEMTKVNKVVYPKINDGVYRCGFARTQEAYNDAYKDHWDGMDAIEELLGNRTFLCGTQFTLSDVRLFVTLIRYDVAYFANFKTSRNMVKDMPNLLRYLKLIYNMPGIKETVNVEHIVKLYYGSIITVNPTGIWPLGPLEENTLKYLEEK